MPRDLLTDPHLSGCGAADIQVEAHDLISKRGLLNNGWTKDYGASRRKSSRGATRRTVDAGVAAIVVSNHGGRQLDGVPPSLPVLHEIAAAVKRQTEVFVKVRFRSDALVNER